ncbi:MAG: exodeoxyribonuclease V subunit gamma [Pirellulales bacterium]|nr:exodeoxyribonuclease V subunit gamma [Pirellulales bacterium]
MNTTSTDAEVQLLAGLPRTGKTDRLLSAYGAFLEQWQRNMASPGGLWIGPAQVSVDRVRSGLVDATQVALFEPQVFTFASFAQWVIADSGQRIRPISSLQKRKILQWVVGEAIAAGKFSHFGPVASTPGFLGLVDERIVQLKRADIWPEDFSRLARSGRDKDLAALYAAYQRRLKEDELYDAEGRFWAAREIISSHPDEPRYFFGHVVVDGFSDFTSAQVDILRLLAARSRCLQISLTLEPAALDSRDASLGRALLMRKTGHTLARLREVLPQAVVEFQQPRTALAPAFQHLRSKLFEDADVVPRFAGPVTGLGIIAAAGEQGEVEEVASRVKTLLQGGQVSPADILVVLPQPRHHARRVGEVFREFEIPHAVDAPERLNTAPLLRQLSGLVRLHLEDWPFRELLGVVGNRTISLFDDVASLGGAGEQTRIAIEKCLRLAQLPSGRQSLLQQLGTWAAADGPEAVDNRLATDARVALEKLEQLSALLAALPERATWQDWLVALERLLAGLGLLPLSGQGARQMADSTECWKRLQNGLRSITAVERKTGDTAGHRLAEVRETLEFIGRNLYRAKSPDPVGRVRVLSAETARHVSAKHVFILGLGEQAFALRDTGAGDGIAAAHDDRESQGGLNGQSELMLLFYELVARATGSLTLSYAALDSKGQPLLPSPMLTELERCFGVAPVPITTMSFGETQGSEANPLSDRQWRRQAVGAALEERPRWLAGLTAASGTGATGAAILDGMACVAQRAKRECFGSWEGLLLSEKAQATLADHFDASHLWSPSQLEVYATCPFRFFSEQLLGLEPLAEFAVRGDAARRGSLLHQVLAAVHQHGRTDGPVIEKDDFEAELVARFLEALQAAVEAAPRVGLEHCLQEIQRREIAAWASGFAQQEKAYRALWDEWDEPPRPAHLEVRFGPRVRADAQTSLDSQTDSDGASTPEPFELDLGSERIRLTAQIDRIDVGRVGGVTGLNIIDYKSGAREVKMDLNKVRSGHQLQLPLYALAAEQHLLSSQDVRAWVAGYWNVRGQGFEKHGDQHGFLLREVRDQEVTRTDSWEQALPDVLARVQQMVNGIRGGHFPVYNEDKHCTRSCPFRTICRVGQIRSLEKVWDERGAEASDGMNDEQ